MFSGLGEGIAAICVLVVVMVTVNKMLGTSLPNINLPGLPSLPNLNPFSPPSGPGTWNPPFTQPPAPSQVLPGQAGVNQAFAEVFAGLLQLHPTWSPSQLVTEAWKELKAAGYPVPPGA